MLAAEWSIGQRRIRYRTGLAGSFSDLGTTSKLALGSSYWRQSGLINGEEGVFYRAGRVALHYINGSEIGLTVAILAAVQFTC